MMQQLTRELKMIPVILIQTRTQLKVNLPMQNIEFGHELITESG